ncbi:hypothetical protein J1N35_023803 [Gossypium stocksii]|uniref:Uncharacterized protein n=1 Tax=Gossypium stocksii TaxID=47602 RepID=A0A9D3VKP1_9ROSI|nr:hypothetical protein J1N35_023803 [Gossypium stocksii]
MVASLLKTPAKDSMQRCESVKGVSSSTCGRKKKQDCNEQGKIPTKAMKEEKTPFDEQIFGTKDCDSQVSCMHTAAIVHVAATSFLLYIGNTCFQPQQRLYYLEEWKVDEGAMPSLQRLEICGCLDLKMLPEGLRFIKTLQEPEDCSNAKGIQR